MKKIAWVISAIILFALTSCQEQTELTDEQKASITSELEKQYSDAMSNLSKLDMNVWSEPWSESAFISVNSGVNYFSRFSEWKDSVTYWFSLRETQQVQIIETKITVLTPELALLTSIANWDVQFKNEEHMKAKALASLLWKKETNGWKIVHLHESWK
jgi:hypothetical protein